MKTAGLNFLEAVQALVDEKCIGIKRAEWTPHIVMHYDYSEWSDGSLNFKAGREDFLATDWLLVSPVTPTEDREVKRWTNVYPNEVELTYINVEAAERHARPDRIACVELTGTYRVPVKEKVRKRVTAVATVDGVGAAYSIDGYSPFRGLGEVCGKTGTLTFEYEE